MKYENLFQKGRIGSVELKNRIVMPAMGVGMAEADGRANEHIIRYYEERAKGGVGMIITEICRVEPEYGTAVPNQLGASELFQVAHLERLAERVHKYGTKILLQLHHPGRENKSVMIGGKQIVAPSAVMCKVSQEMPRALTTEECTNIMKAFVKGAVLAKTAGFDGVELHAAHGYLLNQFLSPYTNKRTDRYGGSFSNRIRIMEEMITAIRHMCGPKFVIGVRISGDEYVEGGLHLDDMVKIAMNLETFGIDVINVSAGIYESSTTIIEPASYPQGWKKHLATAVRKAVNIPVIATNNIKDPEVGDALIGEGVCDYIAIGRANLADPEWSNKAKSGRADEINKCIGCLYCFSRLFAGNHISCAVNPKCGREVEYAHIEKSGNGETVAVIGGGPAGMVAALTLKERGYKPVIFEKADVLGGQLNVADKPILKEKLAAYKQSLITRIEKSGIEVRLGKAATVDDVKALDPAGVFLASGGNPTVPPIPGIDKACVMTAEDVLTGKKTPTGKVAIIGGGITGIETADTLGAKGMDVTIVEMLPEIGGALYKSVLVDFMIRLKKANVKIMTRQQLFKIDDGSVTLMHTQTAEFLNLECDTVILALGVTPDKALKEEFEAAFEDCIVLGDAVKSGRIADATFDGFGRAATF